MQVEIWSDVVCPYCYIGKREFENALAQFPHREDVQVEWKSFELDREAPVRAEDDMFTVLAKKYGRTRGRRRAWWQAWWSARRPWASNTTWSTR